MSIKLSRKANLRLAGVGVIGAAIIVAANGPGVFAGLKAEADTVANPMAANTGDLILALDGAASFATTIDNMAPGDSGTRYIRLDNTGSLGARNLKVKIATDGDDVLEAGDKALRIKVESCSVAFVDGACDGGAATQVSNQVVSAYVAFNDFATPIVLDSGDSTFLKVTTSLPDANETTTNGNAPAGTVQGKTVNLVYTFQQAQNEVVASL
jgi:hypothetical protein